VDQGESNARASIYRQLVVVTLLGACLLAFPPHLFAQTVPPFKGVYYAGYAYSFSPFLGSMSEGKATSQGYQGGNLSSQLPQTPAGSSLGVVAFNGLLYCFFTTTGGELQYLTFDPASSQFAGPTTIATSNSPHGVVAAVYQGVIYVFTANNVYTSGDGKNFSALAGGWTPDSSVGSMLGAVTFYPTDQGILAGIVLVFNDSASTLRSCILYPSSSQALTCTTQILPASPSGALFPWEPVEVGNLVLGTSSWTSGAKVPCVQFYGLTERNGLDGINEGDWEYNLVDKTWTLHDVTKVGQDTDFYYYFAAMPWFDNADTTTGLMRLGHVLIYPGVKFETNWSDWMVPQYADNSWAGRETDTSTATTDSQTDQELRSLWSLVGIVLGPPPWVLNGEPSPCPGGTNNCNSYVSYGYETTNSISVKETTSATLTVATNNEIKAGFADFNLDTSYAQAWKSSHESTTKDTITAEYKWAPDAVTEDWGTNGWALFTAPILYTQLYQLYAYDYVPSSGAGTYLNEDVYATSIGAIKMQSMLFNLQDPSEGTLPGLLEGLPTYPYSTDIPDWFQMQQWDNSNQSDWDVLYEPSSTLDLGTETTLSYTQETDNVVTTGSSNKFSIKAGASFDLFGGYKTGVKVGYSTSYGQESTVESSDAESVSAFENIAYNTCPTCYTQMEVQPYWLMAKTENAPWIPSGYSGNLPWCLAWNVLDYCDNGGNDCYGSADAPAAASAKIRVGKKGRYRIDSGHMTWHNADGTKTAIPMTADQFGQAPSATVSLNGHAFTASAATGKWSRRGDVWKYKTRSGAAEPFALELDFANQTWSFDGRSKDPDLAISAADGLMRAEVDVQGTYGFVTWVRQDASMTWDHAEKKADWQPYGVHEIKGSYNAQNQTGYIVLRGHTPKPVSNFGDVEIRINGLPVDSPLLATTDNFMRKMRHGGTVTYRADGLSFTMNFSTGRWRARIDGDQFKHGMVPKAGAERVQVLFGGTLSSDQKLAIGKHPATLTYGS
jgi:hypothetical protein